MKCFWFLLPRYPKQVLGTKNSEQIICDMRYVMQIHVRSFECPAGSGKIAQVALQAPEMGLKDVFFLTC